MAKNSIDLKEQQRIAERLERKFSKANATRRMLKDSAGKAEQIRQQPVDALAKRAEASRALGEGYFAARQRYGI